MKQPFSSYHKRGSSAQGTFQPIITSPQLSRSLPQLSSGPCHCPSCCSCRSNNRRSWNSPCPLIAFIGSTEAETLNLTSSSSNFLSTIDTSQPQTHSSVSPSQWRHSPCQGGSLLRPIDRETGMIRYDPEIKCQFDFLPSSSTRDSSKRGSLIEENAGFSFGRRKRFRRPAGVPTVQFHSQLKTMLDWYTEFDDSQKNDFLKQLLDKSNLPQTHLLSTLMAPILHANCPHNCTDIFYWLPHPISLQILEYLDPISLGRCMLVNRYWNKLCKDVRLWKKLCKVPFYRLSDKVSKEQLGVYVANNIPWRQVFIERFKLQQNWLKGNCFVRTFEGHTQGITCVQFDKTRIVSGSSDKTIKVWSTKTNTSWAALTLRGHSGTVRCLHLDDNQLISGSTDCTIKVWDLAEGVGWSRSRCRVTMVGHSHTVRCLQVGICVVVSGSYDHTLKKWDLQTGECLTTLRGHTAAVLSVQFDKQRIVSGSCDNTIKIWSFLTGDCISTLRGHQDAVTCIHFDTHRIVSGSLDTQILLWDIKTGRCVQTLDWVSGEGHTGVVRCLQADAWRIVSAADDKTLKVWSLESGKRLVTLREHTDGVTCLQFNDLRIVSGSYDKTVKLWDFTNC